MATRRMFSNEVVSSDSFLDLSPLTRCLYYQMVMEADDDGVISRGKSIARMIGAGAENLMELAAAGFILCMPSGNHVDTYWNRNNFVRKDRYKASVHQDDLDLLDCKDGRYFFKDESLNVTSHWQQNGNQSVTSCQPSGNQTVTNWLPNGDQVVTNCQPSGNQVVTTFNQNSPENVRNMAGENSDDALEPLCNAGLENWLPGGNQTVTKWQPNGNQMTTQARLGKDRLSKAKQQPIVTTSNVVGKEPETKIVEAVPVEEDAAAYFAQRICALTKLEKKQLDELVTEYGYSRFCAAVDLTKQRGGRSLSYLAKLIADDKAMAKSPKQAGRLADRLKARMGV